MTAPPIPSDSSYATVAEVAAEVRTSKMTIYRLVHAGEIPGVIRVGRSLRIPRRAIVEWQKNSTIATEGR